MSEQYEQWQALQIRRPEDVPAGTPVQWMAEKRADHDMLLSNHMLPTDRFPDTDRGDTGDALAVLALGESIRRAIANGRCVDIHQALLLGATWTEVAAALDITTEAAREMLRDWTQRQRNLYLGYEAERLQPFGHTAEQHAAVLALCELGDDQAVNATVPN